MSVDVIYISDVGELQSFLYHVATYGNPEKNSGIHYVI